MSCYPKLQEGFGGTSHKQYWLVIPQMMEGLRFMFGCARQSFSDSVCISNTGFPDVAVSEHDETESHKSFCASQNTIFLIFLAFCAAQGLALCIKMPNSLARFMRAWVLRSKWAVEIIEEKQKTKRKKQKEMQRKRLLLSLSFARNFAPSALLSCTPAWPRRSSWQHSCCCPKQMDSGC